jgi:signal peptidase II
MFWYYLIALIVLAIDQVSKWFIVTNMKLNESWPVIDEFFYITSHRNRGAAFGILQDQRWFFIVITVVVVVGIIWYLHKMAQERRILLCTSLSLLLGGAIGNFIDRARVGEVVDFLHFRFQFAWFGNDVDYHFAIFNIADSAIVIGVALIFLDTLLTWRKEKRGLIQNDAQ